jgi:hypothetical protein
MNAPASMLAALPNIVPWLKQYGQDIIDAGGGGMLLGWIAKESAGRYTEAPGRKAGASSSAQKLDELGYFQNSAAEDHDLGIDHERVGTDPEYSISAGIRLVRHYQEVAEQYGFTPDDPDLYFRIVKFLHTVGSGAVHQMLSSMQAAGADTTDWGAIEDFWNTQNPTRTEWTDLVDQVFLIGGGLAAATGVNPTGSILLYLGLAIFIGWMLTKG